MLDVLGFVAGVFICTFDGRGTAVLCGRGAEGWGFMRGEDVVVR